ncbi:hypothetical protein DSECCO2_197740 [anaerobic digester metagenome]
MAIKPQFTKNDIRKRFDAFLEEVEKAQIEALEKLGEECVIHAREIPAEVGFKDQTGNLRSSMGYVIFKNGTAIRSNYVQVLEGNEGMKAGQQLAEQVGSRTKGIVLVVTAGMNYATYVEAKGRDVLASAELLAQRKLPKILSDFIEDIKLSLQ